MIRSLFSDLGSLLFPRVCPVCGDTMRGGERTMCLQCYMRLPYLNYDDFRDNATASLFVGTFNAERAYSHFSYQARDESAMLIKAFKYHRRPDLARELGRMLASELMPRGFFREVDAIVPVPLHWRRRLWRGYNQCEEMAEGVSHVVGLPVRKDLVRRVRHNKSQTMTTSHAERMRNMHGLFRAKNMGSLARPHLLIVDDVLTTGATIKACVEALRESNPEARFSVLTLGKTAVRTRGGGEEAE